MSDVHPISDHQAPQLAMQQQEAPENDAGLYANRDILGITNPFLSSTRTPDGDSCDLPPLSSAVSAAVFSVHAPPASGYVAGCYLPSPPRGPILPPVGYGYSSSYGVAAATSCPPYSQPVAGPFASDAATGCGGGAAPYSLFPSLFGYNGTIPHLHHPLSDPNVSSTSDSPLPRKRRRPRAEEDELIVDDLNMPAKRIGGATLAPDMPTPPDSGSDRSDSGSPYPGAMAPSSRQIPQRPPLPPPPQDGVRVMLLAKSEDMWNLFFAANTEMIVTKSGRCLFPVLMFSVTGLSRKKDYNVYIRAVLNDQYRYKYLYNQWTRVSESDFVHDETRMISKHPNSPQSGGKWMAKDIDFKSLKITHYPKSKGGDILLNTMHKYFFEMVVEEHLSDSEPLVFPFHLTQFIAVTAYQSAKLTELKKEKNPFARGVKSHDSEPCDLLPQQPITSGMTGYMPYNPVHPASRGLVPYPTPWSQQ